MANRSLLKLADARNAESNITVSHPLYIFRVQLPLSADTFFSRSAPQADTIHLHPAQLHSQHPNHINTTDPSKNSASLVEP